jgi:hypothetical protein
MQTALKAFSDYFMNWRDRGDEVVSASDAAGDLIEEVTLPFNGSDQTVLSLTRKRFDLVVNRDGSWSMGSNFPAGLLRLDSNLQWEGKLSCSSADFPNWKAQNRYGTLHWAAAFGFGAFDAGLKAGPIHTKIHIPVQDTHFTAVNSNTAVTAEQEDLATTELTAVFPFRDSNLTTSVKASIIGSERAVYTTYESSTLSACAEKSIDSNSWTVGGRWVYGELTRVGGTLASKENALVLGAVVSRQFPDWAVPLTGKVGFNTDGRLGLSLEAELGSTVLIAAVDKLPDKAPTVGFSLVMS